MTRGGGGRIARAGNDFLAFSSEDSPPVKSMQTRTERIAMYFIDQIVIGANLKALVTGLVERTCYF